MNFNQSHFGLFGLPQRFDVDTATLDVRYRELQREVHPDRFATASDAQRRLSMQMATRVNEGYRTLKSPLARARYLLELMGADAEAETNTAMPPDFLMQQMEWREGLEEAGRLGDTCGMNRLNLQVDREMEDAYAAFASTLERGHKEAAAAAVRKLMFLDRFREEVATAQEKYEV